jgi:hypothetical protein
MSKLSTGIFGAIAVSLSLGAAQYASGQDLAGTFQISAGTSEATVNRAAKADRTGSATQPATPMRTISLQLESLADTSVLIRLPVAQQARGEKEPTSRTAPSLTNSGNRNPTVACEPVVSILTEVVKQLQPGRCVT